MEFKGVLHTVSDLRHQHFERTSVALKEWQPTSFWGNAAKGGVSFAYYSAKGLEKAALGAETAVGLGIKNGVRNLNNEFIKSANSGNDATKTAANAARAIGTTIEFARTLSAAKSINNNLKSIAFKRLSIDKLILFTENSLSLSKANKLPISLINEQRKLLHDLNKDKKMLQDKMPTKQEIKAAVNAKKAVFANEKKNIKTGKNKAEFIKSEIKFYKNQRNSFSLGIAKKPYKMALELNKRRLVRTRINIKLSNNKKYFAKAELKFKKKVFKTNAKFFKQAKFAGQAFAANKIFNSLKSEFKKAAGDNDIVKAMSTISGIKRKIIPKRTVRQKLLSHQNEIKKLENKFKKEKGKFLKKEQKLKSKKNFINKKRRILKNRKLTFKAKFMQFLTTKPTDHLKKLGGKIVMKLIAPALFPVLMVIFMVLPLLMSVGLFGGFGGGGTIAPTAGWLLVWGEENGIEEPADAFEDIKNHSFEFWKELENDAIEYIEGFDFQYINFFPKEPFGMFCDVFALNDKIQSKIKECQKDIGETWEETDRTCTITEVEAAFVGECGNIATIESPEDINFKSFFSMLNVINIREQNINLEDLSEAENPENNKDLLFSDMQIEKFLMTFQGFYTSQPDNSFLDFKKINRPNIETFMTVNPNGYEITVPNFVDVVTAHEADQWETDADGNKIPIHWQDSITRKYAGVVKFKFNFSETPDFVNSELSGDDKELYYACLDVLEEILNKQNIK